MSPSVRRRSARIAIFVVVGLSAAVAWLVRPASHASLAPCAQPRITIVKSISTLILSCASGEEHTFPVAFGARPRGRKESYDDERTPEGDYTVLGKFADDSHGRALVISYPNDADRKRAGVTVGLLGGPIEIGEAPTQFWTAARVAIRFAHITGLARYWGPTYGDIAMIREDAEALYDVVPTGAPVTIRW